jgi:uncharacterized Tic20 family protein
MPTGPQSPYPMDSGLNVFATTAGEVSHAQDSWEPSEAQDTWQAREAREVGPDREDEPTPARALAPADRGGVRSAMLAYLGVPFILCLLPLAIYLLSLRRAGYARAHAAAALNVSLTAMVYTLCGLIVGGVLVLDSLQVATVIIVPLLALLWLGVLVVLARAAAAASHGELRPVPRWLRLTREPPVSR